MRIEDAIACLKAAGYRVSKPKPRVKDRVGPTFVACFADGQVTRMSTFTSLANLERSKYPSAGEWISKANPRTNSLAFKNNLCAVAQ
jgi:hypothetical protein